MLVTSPLGHLQLGFELLSMRELQSIGFLRRNLTELDQLIEIILADFLPRLDLLVHQRLGKFGNVIFIVPA